MNMCANHPDKEAVAYCRMCGKPLCTACRMENLGAIYCAEDFPVRTSAVGTAEGATPPTYDSTSVYPGSTYTGSVYAGSGYPGSVAPSPYNAQPGKGSPWLALVLGTIPGVGAIYNGQYAKGLIHAVIFGLLITIVNDGTAAPLVGMLIAVWWFYMVLEAYHTARKRYLGQPVDELSSIVNLNAHRAGFPIGAVVLIGAGMLLLFDSTGLIPLGRLIRYWPVALILLGVYMLYLRMDRRPVETLPVQEFSDERR